jgi:hypothetical protein
MVVFDDPLAAMEEMEFLVKETGVTHRMFKKNSGKYCVNCSGYRPKSKTILVAELNCRNTVGNSEINKRRGEKIRQSYAGKKAEKIRGLYQYTAPSRGKKRAVS